MQRDAIRVPQEKSFRPADNSLFNQHLTPVFLLCVFFYLLHHTTIFPLFKHFISASVIFEPVSIYSSFWLCSLYSLNARSISI